MQHMVNLSCEYKRVLWAILLLTVFSLLPASVSSAYGNLSVMIDPAHGGTDKGIQFSGDVYEKDITLTIALMVKKELASAEAVRVQLTRDSDRTMSIREREQAVKSAVPDLFIGIHTNSGFGKKASGFEIYFPGFKGQTQSEAGDSSVILKDMEKNKYLNDSVRFAYILQKNLEQVFPRKGRGLREAPVPVLEVIARPALVIELGFASNSEDRKKMMDKDIQLSIAKAISKSIKELF